VPSTCFRDAEFIIPFCILRSIAAQPIKHELGHTTQPRLNIEPANGITSFPILAHPKWDLLFPRLWGTKGHPPTMGTTNARQHLKGIHVDVADPQVAKLHQVWPSASNPPPSTSLKLATQGQLKASKGKS
jgi:hypothetical protein